MLKLDRGRWELIEKSTSLPISLNDFKNFRNLSIADTTFDSEYTLFLNTAIRLIEKYLNYNLLDTKWNYYLKSFDNIINDYVYKQESIYFTIFGKGNINSIQKISYLKDNSFIEILNTEYLFEKKPIVYSDFNILSKSYFPTDYDSFNDLQIECVKIELTIGFGETSDKIPDEIKLALLQLASKLYDSKGICEYDSDLMNYIFEKISSFQAKQQIY